MKIGFYEKVVTISRKFIFVHAIITLALLIFFNLATFTPGLASAIILLILSYLLTNLIRYSAASKILKCSDKSLEFDSVLSIGTEIKILWLIIFNVIIFMITIYYL